MQIPIIDNNYKMLCNELMWPPWLRSAYAGKTNLGAGLVASKRSVEAVLL